MQTSPNRLSPKKSSTKSALAKSRHLSAQHVPACSNTTHQRSILHRFPYESLFHITSYLDPRSLSALGAVDRFLREYASEDVVWKLALYANVLGIQPEREQDSPRAFLLRRLETTWKGEYITRYSALIKWSKSTTTFTAHNPLMIPVPNIHLLSDGESLFSAPDDFRWVLRTLPATGKLVKGHFQPTLSHQAHPPPDWSPPATGAFASDGGMIKVAWASQTGGVLVKTAPKAMAPKAHRTATSVASTLEDNHLGFIHHLAWGSSKTGCEALISAGGDGRVKIWNAETCQALWTSEFAPDGAPFVLAALDVPSRAAVALTEKGAVVAWTGLPVFSTMTDSEVKTITASLPSEEVPRRYYKASSTLLFDSSSPTPRAIVHAYEDRYASLFSFDFPNETVDIYTTEGPLGAITALHLDIGNPSDKSVLFVGDSLSHVYLYNLDQQPYQAVLKPNLDFAAAQVGSITSITSNHTVLVTGTNLGVITVWDAITLDQIRLIMATDLVKAGAGVLTIVLQAEKLVASVGRSVVHWKTGMNTTRAGKHYKTNKVMAPKEKGRLVDKYYRSIQESQAELEWESRLPPKSTPAYSEHEQKLALEALGIDEYGAVEYALMISHEEALRADAGRQAVDETPEELNTDAYVHRTTTDTLHMDATGTEPTNSIDGTGTPRRRDATLVGPDAHEYVTLNETVDRYSSPPLALFSSTPSVESGRTENMPYERADYMPSSPWKTTSLSKASPPSSIGKVQVSPPYRPEAMQVGELGSSPIHLELDSWSKSGNTSCGGASASTSSVQSDRGEEEFPSIAASTTSSTSTLSRKSSPSFTPPPGATLRHPSGKKTIKPGGEIEVAKGGAGDAKDLKVFPKENVNLVAVAQPQTKWSAIVKSGSSSTASPSAAVNAWTTRDHRTMANGSNLNQSNNDLGRTINRPRQGYMSDEDAQLQFVLELSLAEAISRQT